jgi:hypothetical protein
MAKQRVTLYINADLWRAFRAACVQRGYSASEIVDIHMQEQMTAWVYPADFDVEVPTTDKTTDTTEGGEHLSKNPLSSSSS